MSIIAWIEDQRRLKLANAPKYSHPAEDGSQGLWTRCDHCGVILYIKHLKENQRVCFGCGYHLQMNSQERIDHIIDTGSWRPLDFTLSPCDPLEFCDQKQYIERLKEGQERTGFQDGIQTGTGLLDGIPVALGVMDFNFMGGSMGSVVGEKITRLIEYATQEGLTLLLVSASGGARMQEGILSLMQMAKISAALQVYQSCANLLYISILTSPTTGGVTASFAMLGDLIFSEPKALIGFAGRRVIEQTLQEQLPDDFQTAEYLLHHGLLDLIVSRSFLKQALSETITLYKDAPFPKSGFLPYGVQNKFNLLSQEKIRRKLLNFSTQGPHPEGMGLSTLKPANTPLPYKKGSSESSLSSQKQLVNDTQSFKTFSSNTNEQIQESSNVFRNQNESFLNPSSYREMLLSFQAIFSFSGNDTNFYVSETTSYGDESLEPSYVKKILDNSQIKNHQNHEVNKILLQASNQIIEWRTIYNNQTLGTGSTTSSQNTKNLKLQELALSKFKKDLNNNSSKQKDLLGVIYTTKE